MSKIFKPRRGTTSTFTTGNKSSTILDEGEIFFEVPDSGQGTGRCRIKMGDGSSTYATLPYAIPFTEDELITHNGTDTKSVSASSSIGSSTVSTYLNNAKSGNTLKTIIHNLREAIYRNACDISYLNNNKASTSHTHSGYASSSHTHSEYVPYSEAYYLAKRSSNIALSGTIGANTYTTVSKAVSIPSGYSLMGIMEVSHASQWLAMLCYYIDSSNKVNVTFRNLASSQQSISAAAKVLFIDTTFVG
jgi:hypothetical protein